MTIKNRQFKEKYGPWAIVTGASSGIGKEFAQQLAAAGLNLVLVARRKEVLNETAKSLESKYNIRATTVQADLSRPGSISTVEQATQDLEIGLLVSNAGGGAPGAFLKNDPAVEAEHIHLNVTAHMRLSHIYGQKMAQRGQGGIILVSSTAGYQGVPFMANYGAAKAYILHLGEALHFELKKQGVDVLVLSPGLTETPGTKATPGIDFNKMPSPWMQVGPVVSSALESLGKKPSVIPGGINKVMSFVGRRVMSRSGAASMFGGMMEKMIDQDRL